MTPITEQEMLRDSLDACAQTSTRQLVRELLSRVGDKWTLLLISTLAEGPMRFTALMEAVPGISHRMLTQTLRALERDGLVSRTPYAQIPPRVDYALTELGYTLIPAVLGLVGWVQDHQSEVEANRASADAVRLPSPR